MSDGDEPVFVLVGVVITFVIILIVFVIQGDFNRPTNLIGLGEKMCGQHNLSYDSVKMDNNNIPIIHCKITPEVKHLEDGYLVLP